MTGKRTDKRKDCVLCKTGVLYVDGEQVRCSNPLCSFRDEDFIEALNEALNEDPSMDNVCDSCQ